MAGVILKTVSLLAALSAVFTSPVEQTIADDCVVTAYSRVATAVANCSSIVIRNLIVPEFRTLDLNLKSGTSLTFQGRLTFVYSPGVRPLVTVIGSGVTVKGDPNSVLDGQGVYYWRQPDRILLPRFFSIQTTGGSTFENINLLNCPGQCVFIHGSSDTTLTEWNVDVSRGKGLVGKGTTGFFVSSSNNIVIDTAVVKNQDDCVDVTQGSNYIFKNLICSGGTGLSLSVGQSPADGAVNSVSNVTFTDSQVIDSRTGIHIKTHTNAGTGSINNVNFEKIEMSGITRYGINIQEDFANGLSTGIPKGNIPITGLNLTAVTGSLAGGSSGKAVYILCGDGGCGNWTWSEVSIKNAKAPNQCNFTPSGFKC